MHDFPCVLFCGRPVLVLSVVKKKGTTAVHHIYIHTHTHTQHVSTITIISTLTTIIVIIVVVVDDWSRSSIAGLVPSGLFSFGVRRGQGGGGFEEEFHHPPRHHHYPGVLRQG